MLSETDKNPDFIKSVFKVKLLCFLGFKPNVEKCIFCGSKDNLNYFSIKDNGLKCKECYGVDKGAIHISDSTAIGLKYIVMAPPKKVFSFELKNDSLKELILISKIYLNEKLEKEYK